MSNNTKLPSWDDISLVAGHIEALTREDFLLDAEYDYERAKSIKALLMPVADRKSMAVTQANIIVDADEKLYSLRVKRAHVRSTLKRKDLEYQIMKMQVDVYRTESANNRNAIIS